MRVKGKGLAGIVLLILLLAVTAGLAKADVPLDVVHFPDANFRTYISNHFIDQNMDGVLSSAELADVKEISLQNVQNPKGIEYFTSLQTLLCQGNGIGDMDVSKNTELTTLWCSDNYIKYLDLRNNTKLTSLKCAKNMMAILDVSALKELSELECEENRLESLDLTKNAKLRKVSAQKNELTSLKVAGLYMLHNLTCESNQLTELNIAGCSELIHLYRDGTRTESGGTVTYTLPYMQLRLDASVTIRETEEEEGASFGIEDLTYSFKNSSSSLGYSGSYKIPLKIYQLFFKKADAEHLYQDSGNWAGSCGGFALSSALYNTQGSGLSLSAFGAGKVSYLSTGSHASSYGLSARDITEAFQIIQKTDPVRNGHIQGIKSIVNAVQNGIKTHKPVVVAIYGQVWGQTEDGYKMVNAGHALVGYKVVKESSSLTKLYVYDCNYPKDGSRYISLYTDNNGNYTGWYYHLNNSYDWGTGNANAEIWCYAMGNVSSAWRNRNTGTISNSWKTTVNVKDYSVEDARSGKVLAVANGGRLTRKNGGIEVYKGVDEDPNAPALIFSDSAELRIVNKSSKETFSVTSTNGNTGAFVKAAAAAVSFKAKENGSKNLVQIDGKGSRSFDITFYTDAASAGGKEKLRITGSGEDGADVEVGLSGGDVVLNNCTDLNIEINGKKVDNPEKEIGKNINLYQISLEFTEAEYTGKAVTPGIVFGGGVNLVLNKDYKVAYKNNVKPSVEGAPALAEVAGIGKYTGVKTLSFTIRKGAELPETFTKNNLKYKITKGTAAVTGVVKSKASVKIPDTVKVNGKVIKVTAIANNAFKKDGKLTTVTIGKNVKTIGKNAFAQCKKLKTVKGGQGITSIGAAAFQKCVKLTAFTLNKKVKTIEKNAFSGCSALKTIDVKTTLLTEKTVKANAFKGIYKKAVFKCPGKKLKAYKKLFLKAGAPKTCLFK